MASVPMAVGEDGSITINMLALGSSCGRLVLANILHLVCLLVEPVIF